MASTAFALLLLLAALLGALVVTLGRQADRTSRQQAGQQMRTAAQLAASSVRTELANLRTRGARLAAEPLLQQAVSSGDRAALQKIALATHARIDVRGGPIGALAPRPRLTTTVVLEAHDAAVAHVTLSLPLDRHLLARLRRQVPMPAGASLTFVEGGSASPKSSVAARAAVAPGMWVVADEALGAVDARAADYLHELVFAAVLTFLLAVVVVGRLVRPLRTLVGDLSRRAEVDSLTGLANRRMVEERLHDEAERALRHCTELSLVLLDVDDFKRINDRLGHPCGDEVLRAVANVLAASVRSSDLAGRFGGEEFAIVLPGTGASGAARVAEQVRDAVANLDVADLHGNERVHVTASLGVAAFSDARSVDRLVEWADRSLYDAKHEGKNRVAVDRSGAAEDLAVV